LFLKKKRMAILLVPKAWIRSYESGGFISRGMRAVTWHPNMARWRAGGRHKGLIQFGSSEQKLIRRLLARSNEVGGRKEKYFRYFKTVALSRACIDRAYATVCVGNPNVSLSAKMLLVHLCREQYHALKNGW
jgi:hypothetical protein